ncbi:hypothetical protein SY88_13535 [Clostridiales bacterium PH28_bin88]|nr:hypothetical protein SY88_13535 [Clostridiales bacterium PH28_bin88]
MEVDVTAELNRPDWKMIQASFSEKLSLPLTVLGEDGTLMYMSGSIPAFCQSARKTGGDICGLCRQGMIGYVLAEEGERASSFQCHCGLTYLITAVKVNDSDHMIALAGAAYIRPGVTAEEEELASFACGIPEELRPHCSSLPVFTRQEVGEKCAVLTLFARHLKSHVERVRLRERDGYSTILLDGLLKLTPGVNPETTYEYIADSILSLPGVETGLVGIVNGKDNSVSIVCARGILPPDFPIEFTGGKGIGSWVLREGRCLAISDVARDPRLPLDTAQRLSRYLNQIVCCPVIVTGKVSALLYAGSRSRKGFEPVVIECLERMTRVLALLMEAGASQRRLAEHARRMTAVYEVARIVNSSLDLKTVLNLVVDLAVTLFDVPEVYLYLHSDENQGNNLCIRRGLNHEEISLMDQGECLAQTDKAVSMSEFPLTVKGKTIGLLRIGLNTSQLDEEDEEVIRSFCNLIGIAIENSRLYMRMQNAYHSTVLALMRVVEVQDPYTGGHSERVGNYAAAVARRLGMDEKTVEELKLSGYLHDVGKIGVPWEVLNKAGNLSPPEMELIRKHPVIGAEIIDAIPELRPLVPAVKYHHERLDGSGYPEGLRGDRIPFEAQVVAVVDVYEALLSRRAHRDAISPREAIRLLREEAGYHLNPKVVDAFCDVVRDDLFLSAEGGLKTVVTDPPKIAEESKKLLTDRESEVLGLIAEGLSNREIADSLYISEKTVKTHITNILRKLNVSDRTKAAVFALQSGLVG